MPNKIPVYCVPGLGASSKIFEFLNLPQEQYELIHLEWLIPESKDEPLENYVQRMTALIEHDRPVLIGVSFGGIIVQEMSRIIDVQEVFIISSVKRTTEMPGRLKWLKKTGLFKLLPVNRISRIDDFTKYGIHQKIRRKAELYNRYMQVRNEIYLNWSIQCVLNWKGVHSGKEPIHIHGTRDEIFPIKHISNCIAIEGGTHAMIITKAKKISQIILNTLES